MRRAIVVALGTGAIITSAAALSIGTAAGPRQTQVAQSEVERVRVQQGALAEQRSQVEARYLASRARCETLGGAKRHACFISAHAERGRTLMEIQAPYERART